MNTVDSRRGSFSGWGHSGSIPFGLAVAVCCAGFLIASVVSLNDARAQVSPNLERGKEHDHPHLLPIFGARVAKKGIELPLPLGVSLNYVFVSQGIDINGIDLKINDGDYADFSEIIEFEGMTSTIHTAQLRLDMWLFPFLNVYGVFGGVYSDTLVNVAEPMEIQSNPIQWGYTVGLGAVLAYGIEQYFVSLNYNLSWAFMELLDGAAMAHVFSPRVGRNFNFKNGMGLSAWLGAQLQYLNAADDGSIKLSDAIDSPGDTQLPSDVRSTPWYNDLGPVRQAIADRAIDHIQGRGGNPEDTVVGYAIEKAVSYPWNLLVGARVKFSDRWFLTTEAGLINRYQFMVGFEFRYGLGMLAQKILKNEDGKAAAPYAPVF